MREKQREERGRENKIRERERGRGLQKYDMAVFTQTTKDLFLKSLLVRATPTLVEKIEAAGKKCCQSF